ncbi:MAG: EutN/CcmL family microcompartment protein [Clostridiales bacterium]|nr:EutN/CcmL family microcompartment protein [Clostridiales bacterium]
MILAKVTGAVVPSVKDARLTGLRLLAAAPLAEPSAAPIAAADTLGAGVGDTVLIATGQAARWRCPVRTCRWMRRWWRFSSRHSRPKENFPENSTFLYNHEML